MYINIEREKMKNNYYDLNLILPNYDELERHIDIFRKQAKENIKSKENKINNKEYFNNISILGERGTGKTSILLRLAEELNKDSYNIVFKLITPEIINKEEDLLGWVISLLSEKIDEIDKIEEERYYRNEYFCEIPKKTIIREKLNKLKTAYFLRRSTYDAIIINDYSSKFDYVGRKSEKLNADVQLQQKFIDVVDEVVKYYRKDDGEPLLIFMFDDVDIFSSRVSEVLNIIIKYFSNSNIVTFIAGEYNSFIENITTEFLKEESLLHSSLMDMIISPEGLQVKEIRKRRAYELLKKVLPPNHRYFIPKLNNENKYNLIISEYKDTNIFKLIMALNQKYINYNDEIIFDYFEIFDDRVRGFVNAINYINSKENLSIENINNFKYSSMKSLLNIIVESSKDLQENRYLIDKVFNIPKADAYRVNENDNEINFKGYINYYFIKDEVEKEKERSGVLSKEKFDVFYKIFVLGNFFELLYITFDDRRKKVIHGDDELYEIINQINSQGKIVPKIDTKSLIYIKGKLFEKLKYDELQQLFDKKSSVYLRANYIDVFKYYKKETHNKNIGYIFKEIMNLDYSWVEEQVDWIYSVAFSKVNFINEEIYEINKKYKVLTKIINLNNLSTDILEQSDINVSKFEFNDTINNTNILDILYYLDQKEGYADLNKRLGECQNNKIQAENSKESKLEAVKEIEDIYENVDEKCTTIEILTETLKEFLNDKVNNEMWSSIKQDLRFLKGSIVDESLKDDDSNFSNLISGRIINVNYKDYFNKDILNNLKIIGEDYTIYSPTLNIFNEDSINFVKEYYSKSLLFEELQKHPINNYKIYKKDLLDLNNRISRYTEEEKFLKTQISNLLLEINDFKLGEYLNENNIQEEYYSLFVKEIILYNINELQTIEDKLLQIELFIKSLCNLTQKNLYIDNDFLSKIRNYIRQYDSDISRREYSSINHILNQKSYISDLEFKMIYNFIKNRIDDIKYNVNHYSRITKKVREINLENNNLMEISLFLEKEKERRDREYYILKQQIIKESLSLLIKTFVQIKLVDKENKMKKREIDKYLTKIKDELDNFVENEKSISLLKDYLINKNKERSYVEL